MSWTTLAGNRTRLPRQARPVDARKLGALVLDSAAALPLPRALPAEFFELKQARRRPLGSLVESGIARRSRQS